MAKFKLPDIAILKRGKFPLTIKGKATPCLNAWRHMIGRCYLYTHKYPTYKYCYVCEDWLNYQNFAAWYHANYIEGFQLDKDLLVKDNKVYSPETCSFVPQELNKLLNNHGRIKSKLPQGVYSVFNPIERFTAQISKEGVRCYLGSFATKEEAYLVYKTEKELHVKAMAKLYYSKGLIKKGVYDNLIKWEL